MNKATYQFSECLKVTRGVGLFYFTGYGMQLKGRNYLLPVDVDIRDKADVIFDTFPIRKLFRRLSAAKNRLNIIILDASHKNPYPIFERRGLARESPTGSGFVIAFSTQKDKNTMAQGANNSLYMRELIKILEKAMQTSIRIEDVFMQVGNAVEQKSSGQQVPWYSCSLERPFYFGKPQPPRIRQDRAGQDRALLVGIDTYQYVSPLRSSKTDVEEMLQFIQKVWNYQPHQIRTLLDEQATRKNILNSIDNWLIKGTQPGDRVFFFYSGHGYYIWDDNGDESDGYDETLIPVETKLTSETMIRDDEIVARLQRLKGRQVMLVIDAPHSGGMTDGLPGKVPDMIAYSAVASNQVALVDIENPYRGVFTHRFIEGVEKKLADSNHDGQVTHAELLDYVRRESQAYCDRHKEQCTARVLTPQLEARPEMLDKKLDFYPETAHQPTQHALVVGINQYQGRILNLKGAVNDAKLLRDTLRRSPVQLPDKRVLLDARATRSAFIQAWQDMVKQAKPGDTLILTYAGNSKQQQDTAPLDEKDNKDEILIFHDFNPKHPTQGRITDDELYSLFKQANEYKILFIVDGCDWGGDDDVGMLPAHVTMITATQGGLVPETILDNKPHGALSWFFAQALTGKADDNQNGRLERDELDIFLKGKIVKHMNALQKPNLFPRGDNVSVFKYRHPK